MIAGETDEDDLSDEPVAKKPKGRGSDLMRSNIGKKSKKLITEVKS